MLQVKPRVQVFYNARAGKYWEQGYASRNIDSLVKLHVQEQVLAMLDGSGPPGGRVLEIGCGPGVLALPLMAKGYEYWGMDLSPGMILEARSRLPAEARLWVGQAEGLGVPDGCFDVVTCVQVLDYMERDEGVLSEVWRVLKPGGIGVLTAVVASSISYGVKKGLGIVLRLPLLRSYLRGRGLVFYTRTRGVSTRAFHRRLKGAGLEVQATAWANLINIPVNFPLPGPTFSTLKGLEYLLARSPLRVLGSIMIVKVRKGQRG